MTQVLTWQRETPSARDVRHVVHALRRGKVVAFPTESGYGLAASALASQAVERLGAGSDGLPLPVVVRSAAEALDWVPHMSPLGRRLARRCWPGPIFLAFDRGQEGVARQLPEGVRQRICPDGTLIVRPPCHDALLQALRDLRGPLVLVDAPEAATAGQLVGDDPDRADLVLDDGPSATSQPPTVIKVEGDRWNLLREGTVSAADVERVSLCVVIFICTGNTCRSPMAEALCKKLLADRLACTVEELPQRGFVVLSAGLAAMMGGGPAAEAVEAARELGADLGGHVSRPLTAKLAAQADWLVAMTRGHLQALTQHASGHGARLRLLAADGVDVADPIGAEQQVYRDCARQILGHLEGLLPELHPS
jgi:protein-tyrosine-phosphatase/tRNA A37 threonylcarbamoyladenosine synthetase subunit TsaC/SUA5/YrdC